MSPYATAGWESFFVAIAAIVNSWVLLVEILR